MFEVGEKVVCVDDSWNVNSSNPAVLKVGRVYTISRIRSCNPLYYTSLGRVGRCVFLQETKNIATRGLEAGKDIGFNSLRFRSLPDTSQAKEEILSLFNRQPAEQSA